MLHHRLPLWERKVTSACSPHRAPVTAGGEGAAMLHQPLGSAILLLSRWALHTHSRPVTACCGHCGTQLVKEDDKIGQDLPWHGWSAAIGESRRVNAPLLRQDLEVGQGAFPCLFSPSQIPTQAGVQGSRHPEFQAPASQPRGISPWTPCRTATHPPPPHPDLNRSKTSQFPARFSLRKRHIPMAF